MKPLGKETVRARGAFYLYNEGFDTREAAIARARRQDILDEKSFKNTPGELDAFIEPRGKMIETGSYVSLDTLLSTYTIKSSGS
jgi:hypothetical protein